MPEVQAVVVDGMTDEWHIGVQLYVSLSGNTVIDLAAGRSHPDVDITHETLMPWLSATKPIAAVAIAQLCERHLLGYDDLVTRYIPRFAAHGKDRITLRHLLTHTGGFRLAPFRYPQDDWNRIIDKICEARLEPRWTPGEKAGYHSSSSWFILGQVIQTVTGMSFSSYVREHIFLPLNMPDCWIGMPEETYRDYGDRIGSLLNTESRPFELHQYHDMLRVTQCNPGVNGFGPINQLARFYQMFLADGQCGDRQIIRPETVQLLTSRQRKGLHDHTFGLVVDWGLGFIIDSKRYGMARMPYGYGPHASDNTFGHAGYQCSLAFADPGHQLVVAFVFNGTPGEAAHMDRNHAVLAAIYESLNLV